MNGPGSALTLPVPDESSTEGPDMANRTSKGQPIDWLTSALLAQSDECQEWPYARTQAGYGQVRIQGKLYSTHRLALVRSGHPEPDAPNNHALHSCDNPPCVNPRHLRWGSHAENQAEKASRGRAPQGAGSALSKLTEVQVRDIQSRNYSIRGMQSIVAREFGVTQPHISRLISGERWSYLKEKNP